MTRLRHQSVNLRHRFALTLAAMLVAASCAAQSTAPSLVRGPYLQAVGPHGGIVAWRTTAATSSWLGWGPAPGVVTHWLESATTVVDHALPVTGLRPEETVYYQVGTRTGVLAGGDAGHRLTAAPDASSSATLRLWVIGDSGLPGTDADHVRDAFLAADAGAPISAWLLLGDNAYDLGTESQYQAAFFDEYAAVAQLTAAWPALGNHDSASSDSATQTGPFFTAFILPVAGELGGVASGTEAWGSYDLGLLHLIRLDSSGSSLATGSPMLTWLAADLAATEQPWRVAYFHHPPYTKGSHDSDNPADSDGRMQAVRANVLPILEGSGVDLVLAGHSHGYERSHLVDGHYGDSTTWDASTMELDAGDGDPGGAGPYRKPSGPHGGTVYVVAGSSSRLNPGPFDHPAMPVAFATLGSLLVQVAGDRLDVRFLDDAGAVRDHFAIVKGSAPFFADGLENGSTEAWSTGAGAARAP